MYSVYKMYLHNLFLTNSLLIIASYFSDCLGRRLGPRLLGRGNDGSMVLICPLFNLIFSSVLRICFIYLNLYSNVQRLVRDLYVMLDKVNSEEAPLDLKVPETFDEFIWDMKNNDYDLRSFAFKLKATVS
jgi:galacturonosyltransferase 12/13/14/15